MKSKVEKPPYRVPSMAEIAELEGQSGLSLASTFSGGGGSCLGHKMAGHRVLWANEMDPHAVRTYRRNFPGTMLDDRDLHVVSGQDVLLATGLGVGDLDILDGSPPCQSFSTAGRRRLDDPRGTLFGQFKRLIDELRPRAFIAENVVGMATGTMRGTFLAVLEVLRSNGYKVAVRQLDAQWLGVPQARNRLFFVGFRDDTGLDPADAFPDPLPYRYSVADACPWIVKHSGSNSIDAWRDGGKDPRTNTLDSSKDPAPTVTKMHATVSGANYVLEEKVPASFPVEVDEGYAKVNKIDLVKRPFTTIRKGRSPMIKPTRLGDVLEHATIEHVGGFGKGKSHGVDEPCPTLMKGGIAGSSSSQVLLRGTRKPSPTVTKIGGTSAAAVVVDASRKFTIPELLRIGSFPDDFEMDGPFAEQWARVGNSVPPLMMRALSTRVGRMLGGKL